MQRMLRPLTLVVTALAGGCAHNSSDPVLRSDSPTPFAMTFGSVVADSPLSFVTVSRYVSNLAQLPSWPMLRQLDPNEWAALWAAAEEFQDLPPYLVEQVLLAHSIRARTILTGDELVSELSKPMLLLRVMFVLPEASWVEGLDPGVRLLYEPMTNGGLPADDPERQSKSLGFAGPVGWSNGHPSLVAFRGILTFEEDDLSYAPNVEFRFFLKHFRFRNRGPGVDL